MHPWPTVIPTIVLFLSLSWTLLIHTGSHLPFYNVAKHFIDPDRHRSSRTRSDDELANLVIRSSLIWSSRVHEEQTFDGFITQDGWPATSYQLPDELVSLATMAHCYITNFRPQLEKSVECGRRLLPVRRTSCVRTFARRVMGPTYKPIY